MLKSLILVVCVLASCAGPLAAANTIFVTVAGLDCKNVDSQHAQAFNAISFSFAATNPFVPGGGGANKGKANFGDPVVLKSFDPCTPKLLEAMAGGAKFNEVTFEWQATIGSGAPLVFMKITMQDARVTAVDYGAAQESVSFGWVSMTLDFWQIRPDGTLGAKVSMTWNRATNSI